MKIILLIQIILLFTTFLQAKQYTYILEKYNKEMDLEAKIIYKIANDILHKDIKLFIPNISKRERIVYSKYFNLQKECKDSNFVFNNKNSKNIENCEVKEKLFFTNSYKKLRKRKDFFGAFFWNKSRPNIIFIKSRLKNQKIKLPKSYNQFIEDF